MVLAGMGPTAEPLIQILETANDVIMRLVRTAPRAARLAGLLWLRRRALGRPITL